MSFKQQHEKHMLSILSILVEGNKKDLAMITEWRKASFLCTRDAALGRPDPQLHWQHS